MTCPRCAHHTVKLLATAEVDDAWRVLHCARCRYTWRTTEPPRRTDPATYPPEFNLTQTDIDTAPEVPAIPPLTHTRN